MSTVAVASPVPKSNVMQNPDSVGASPQPQRRHHNNKATRINNTAVQQDMGTVSDSNLPGISTPKSKKQPRGKQQGDRAASVNVPNHRSGQDNANKSQRARPTSIAAQNQPVMATPQKAAAYAGPTFHASPAPSSLPVPKFFSKSVPAASGPEAGFLARLEKEKEHHESASESENGHLLPPGRNIKQSPLDMFFKADRQERAQRHGSSGLDAVLQQKSAQSRSETPERPQARPSNSSKDLFMLELDESDSPAAKRGQKSAQSAKRMTADRSISSPSHVPTLNDEEAQRAAYTQSLKNLLNLPSSEAPSPKIQPAAERTAVHSPVSPFVTPHDQRVSSGFFPTTPQQDGPEQSNLNLAYGNRNLSPLFQAVRHDSPTRPSALRQQIHPQQQQAYPRQQASLPDHARSQSQLHTDPSATPQMYPQHQMPQSSPMRHNYPAPSPYPPSQLQYLQYPQQQQPFQPFSSPNSHITQHHFQQQNQQGVSSPQHQYQHQQTQPNGSPAPQNVKSMEDDLRRILKLNMS